MTNKNYDGKVEKGNLSIKHKVFIYSCFIMNILAFLGTFFDLISLSFTKELEPNDFVAYMEKNNCKITKSIEKAENSTIETYNTIYTKECPFEIKYFIVEDADVRDDFYYTFIEVVENNKNRVERSSINAMNYFSHSSAGENYKTVIMNKKSILYLNTKINNRQKAIKVLHKLGYNDKKYDKYYEAFSKITSIYTIIILIICWWKINIKMGRKWWVMFIPIYNVLCLSEDILGKKLYCLLLLTPFSTPIFNILILYNLGKVFGLNENKRILTIFLFLLYVPMIAFDNSQYTKPIVK